MSDCFDHMADAYESLDWDYGDWAPYGRRSPFDRERCGATCRRCKKHCFWVRSDDRWVLDHGNGQECPTLRCTVDDFPDLPTE